MNVGFVDHLLLRGAMEDPRHGANLKFERAKRLMGELNHLTKAFFESQFYSISSQTNPDTGKEFVRVEIKPLPDELPVIVGDIIHNLRSSLDLVWGSMRRSLGATDTTGEFPFAKERDDLESTVLSRDKVVTVAIPEIRRVILEDVQPYMAGNAFLWALHDLNRIDKHRILITAVHTTQIPIHMVDENGNVTVHHGKIFDSGVIDIRGAFGDLSVKEVGYGEPTIKVVFDIALVQGEPVFPMLYNMIIDTRNAIDAVCNAWEAHHR